MTHPISISQVSLHPSTPLDINDGIGTTVIAVCGNVWITQSGDPHDIVLSAGQSFTVDRNGLTLVAALGAPAQVTVIPPQPVRFTALAAAGLHRQLPLNS